MYKAHLRGFLEEEDEDEDAYDDDDFAIYNVQCRCMGNPFANHNKEAMAGLTTMEQDSLVDLYVSCPGVS